MTLDVPKDEFETRWTRIETGDENIELYTNGILKGTIQYEDDNYIVIKLGN